MRLIVPLALSVLLTFAVSACSGLARQLDVVGRESVASFDALLKAAPENVAADDMNGGWSFAAPDGTAKFIWSRDYSKSPLHDVMLELDAQPFLDAGLNVNALPENVEYYDGKLTVGTKLGDDELEYISEATPLSSYEHLVEIYRGVIGYHAALDHYGVSLGGGNLFEWAKDTGANDKDVVFVLEPELWIAAGTDPNNIDGWVFAKVTVDVDGKPAEVDKILKAFDLER
jgi:hypothetical protein